jgi:hypothetical protein
MTSASFVGVKAIGLTPEPELIDVALREVKLLPNESLFLEQTTRMRSSLRISRKACCGRFGGEEEEGKE